jgi:cell division protein ZapA
MSSKVEIFGTQYTFEGDDAERIRAIAEYVDRKMRETSRSIKNITTSRVAVMTAMNIADDLFRCRESTEQASRGDSERLDRLIGMCQQLGLPLESNNKMSP